MFAYQFNEKIDQLAAAATSVIRIGRTPMPFVYAQVRARSLARICHAAHSHQCTHLRASANHTLLHLACISHLCSHQPDPSSIPLCPLSAPPAHTAAQGRIKQGAYGQCHGKIDKNRSLRAALPASMQVACQSHRGMDPCCHAMHPSCLPTSSCVHTRHPTARSSPRL
jgi:hypothetical protein